MSRGYNVVRKVSVPNSTLVNVYFQFDATSEGNVTVPESIVDTPQLGVVIELQLKRLRDQLDQLAAGGD